MSWLGEFLGAGGDPAKEFCESEEKLRELVIAMDHWIKLPATKQLLQNKNTASVLQKFMSARASLESGLSALDEAIDAWKNPKQKIVQRVATGKRVIEKVTETQIERNPRAPAAIFLTFHKLDVLHIMLVQSAQALHEIGNDKYKQHLTTLGLMVNEFSLEFGKATASLAALFRNIR